MRPSILCFVLAATVSGQAAFPVETRTSEGVRIWDFGGASADDFSFAVFVAAGSRLENPDEYGVAHLVEHCLFRSTALRSHEAVLELLKRCSYNGFTSFDQTVYHFAANANDALPLIELFGEMLTKPAFAEDEVEAERRIVFEEITQRDMHVSINTLEDLVYPGDPLGRSIGGDRDAVKATSTETVKAFYSEHYRRGNVIVAFRGGGDRRAIAATLDAAFAGLPEGGGSRPRVSTPAGRTGVSIVGNPMEEKAVLFSGFHVSERTTTGLAALWVLEQWLHERFTQVARHERGLAYAPSVQSIVRMGAWRLQAAAESSRQENIREIDQILTEITGEVAGITEEQFERARSAALADLIPENPAQLAAVVYKTWILMHLGSMPPDPCREVLALTREDFVRAAAGLTEARRYRLTNDPTLGSPASPPWLGILGVIVGGLLIIDAFFGFRGARGLIERPLSLVRGVRSGLLSAREQRRARHQRQLDARTLQDEIQAWYSGEEQEHRTPADDQTDPSP